MPNISTMTVLLISVSVLLASIAGCIAWHNKRIKHEKRFREAADVFREKVLDELKGLYPIPRFLEAEEIIKFSESIPGIESASFELSHFLPSENRDAFDNALKNYCEHCKTITWSSCVMFKVLPGRNKPEDEGPKEIFRQNVVALLSFAKIEQKS